MVKGIVSHRRFIWQSAVAELRHRYAGTGLGVVWNVVHPLALISVYSAVFTTLMRPQLPPGVAAGRVGGGVDPGSGGGAGAGVGGGGARRAGGGSQRARGTPPRCRSPGG